MAKKWLGYRFHDIVVLAWLQEPMKLDGVTENIKIMLKYSQNKRCRVRESWSQAYHFSKWCSKVAPKEKDWGKRANSCWRLCVTWKQSTWKHQMSQCFKAVKGEDFLIETRGRERTMKKASKIEKRGK